MLLLIWVFQLPRYSLAVPCSMAAKPLGQAHPGHSAQPASLRPFALSAVLTNASRLTTRSSDNDARSRCMMLRNSNVRNVWQLRYADFMVVVRAWFACRCLVEENALIRVNKDQTSPFSGEQFTLQACFLPTLRLWMEN